MNAEVKTRKVWLDFLRGLAMLLVVFCHQAKGWNDFIVFTTPARIPLFFFISGFLFKPDVDFVTFIKKLFLHLVVPYCSLVILMSLCLIPLYGIHHPVEQIQRMVSGDSYWFMPCLIVGEVVFYFLQRWLRKPLYLLPAAVVLFVAGWWLHEFGVLNYGMVNVSLEIQLFLLFGYSFRIYEEQIGRFFDSWGRIAALLAVYCVLFVVSLVLFPGKRIDFHHSYYYNFPLCFALIVTGLLSVVLIARKINRSPRFMNFVGQNSLVLYLWAPYAIMVFRKIMRVAGITLGHTPFVALIVTIWAAFLCGGASMLLNRFCPVLVGKKRKK